MEGIGRMERAISVVTDVHDLSELLSGARIEQAQVAPHDGQLELVVDLTRAMLEHKTTVRQGLIRRVKVPWTKCRLRLQAIASASIKRLAELPADHTPILVCEPVKGGYQLTVQAHDGLQFVLGLEQLRGTFSDVGSPIDAP